MALLFLLLLPLLLPLLPLTTSTRTSTVVGQVEGPAGAVEEMVAWLRDTGSPKSRVDKAVFGKRRAVTAASFTSFQIHR